MDKQVLELASKTGMRFLVWNSPEGGLYKGADYSRALEEHASAAKRGVKTWLVDCQNELRCVEGEDQDLFSARLAAQVPVDTTRALKEASVPSGFAVTTAEEAKTELARINVAIALATSDGAPDWVRRRLNGWKSGWRKIAAKFATEFIQGERSAPPAKYLAKKAGKRAKSAEIRTAARGKK